MSTTSTGPALAGHYHTLGDNSELLNCMCVLVIASSDGTLIDATSVWEEDIVELCVEVGKTYPKGVLWLSVMESVILF